MTDRTWVTFVRVEGIWHLKGRLHTIYCRAGQTLPWDATLTIKEGIALQTVATPKWCIACLGGTDNNAEDPFVAGYELERPQRRWGDTDDECEAEAAELHRREWNEEDDGWQDEEGERGT